MQSFHKFEDDIIECCGILNSWDEWCKLALNLLGRHAFRGVKVREDSSIEMKNGGLHVKDFHSNLEGVVNVTGDLKRLVIKVEVRRHLWILKSVMGTVKEYNKQRILLP